MQANGYLIAKSVGRLDDRKGVYVRLNECMVLIYSGLCKTAKYGGISGLRYVCFATIEI